ncbi:MAG: hypothetical protein JG781_1222 [Peptococcaceae bacterium]|jgi:hypothetical protein|nr:hypothetical protein [Peptococcaceae bacterium]
MFADFKIAKYEITLEAGEEGLHLPAYKGSTLRGGFGTAFRRIACAQPKSPCSQCLLKSNCPYAYIFETEPPPDSLVLKNYDTIPRPFVLEPPLETRTFYGPGERLTFHLLLFGRAIPYLPYFIVVFRELGELGIGKGRKKYRLAELTAVNDLTEEREVVYSGDNQLVRNFDLTVSGRDVLNYDKTWEQNVLSIDFQTMTRLKFEGRYVGNVPFHILIRNLLRRLSSLYYFHHGVMPNGNFQEIIKQAEKIRTVSEEFIWVDWERYSSRQDTRMNLGGVVGNVTYEGELAEFMPLLTLGQFTHVGKGATFGMGKYQVRFE